MNSKNDAKVIEPPYELIESSACFNNEHVANARNGMASPADIIAMSEVFKAASEPLRAAILSSLMAVDELCVCDIAASIDASRSAVSRQLRYLREHDIVAHRKAAQLVFYSLKDQCIKDLLDRCLEHVRHSSIGGDR